MVFSKKKGFKRYRRRGARRFRKHYKKPYKRTLLLNKSINVRFPPCLRTTMHASYNVNVSPTDLLPDAGCNYYCFRGNCIIDCGVATTPYNNSFAGPYTLSQCSGSSLMISSERTLDALASSNQAAPYTKYMVLGSRIKLKFASDTTGSRVENATALNAALIPYANELVGTSQIVQMPVNTIAEQSYAKSVLVPAVTTGKSIVLSNSITTKKIFGLTRNLSTNDEFFSGTYDSAPAADKTFVWLLAVNRCDNEAVSSQAEYGCRVDLYYDTLFYDRNMIMSNKPI